MRPHEGLCHPVLPRAALTPNQMWAALVCVAGHVPLPLTATDYLELLPVRWQAITERGIRTHHRTYDHDLLAPRRGHASLVAARGGKWEVHINPHDLRQIWVRLPDDQLTEIPWIHRDHTHHPFNENTWNRIRTTITHYTGHDYDSREADLADALDQLMRRARNQTATRVEQHLLARTASTRALPAGPHEPGRQGEPDPDADRTGPTTDHDSLDELDDSPDGNTIEDDCADSHTPDTASKTASYVVRRASRL
ncbi:Mu transposase C-terminal domain-containing protein [Streptomyces sp. NPDC005786]|uniref:Mu transposase C-terminal domain-containing protein n=1 Tax=Streptomyces sp. NPDC005786 TaxID=3154891 RepID=UPI0034073389